MRDLDSLKPDEIRAELTKMINEDVPPPNHRLADGGFEVYHVTHDVARRLGSSTTFPQNDFRAGAVYDRFIGRCKRALDKLAADGELVRFGDGDRLPSGQMNYRSVRYYTPETVSAAEAERDRKQAEADAIRARWDAVSGKLANLGYFWSGDGTDHKLSLADWEQLLGQWYQETGRS